MMFRTSKGEPISLDEIVTLVEDDYEYSVFVGTDSQLHRRPKIVKYATCIVLYKKGKGGSVFVNEVEEGLTNSLRQRLANETWKSVETSMALAEKFPSNVEIIVHIDVNPSRKFKSGNYYQELVGMVTGQGFKAVIKPHAWAAQSIADKFSKKRIKGKRRKFRKKKK